MMPCHAHGHQGSWFADVTARRHPEVDGRSLPCIWDFWWKKGTTRYVDPGYAPGNPKAEKVVEALKSDGFAIMRKRRMTTANDVWEADGYIAIFEVANVKFGDKLEFDIVRRVCDLD
ncbi:hypothetical protein [Qipengyuania flava]|uniref:hypothetical protein n=1 Tax=Qipengyuania flava TaxID=192812 RepID=UPI0012FD2F97|nr:hypothetical protein [Qipengyuania flava]